jgi:hypothetical protein
MLEKMRVRRLHENVKIVSLDFYGIPGIPRTPKVGEKFTD